MDDADVISLDEHSVDEDQTRALTERYIDEETSAQLEH
jgi:hypothetical protein